MIVTLELYIRDGKAVGDFTVGDVDYGQYQFGFDLDKLEKVKEKIQELMVKELEHHDKDSLETIIAKANADRRTISITDDISGHHRVITVYRNNGTDGDPEIKSLCYQF
jgi:hypothetical protein